MMTDRIYGTLPIDLGEIDLEPVEMLFWLYCPIKLPNSDYFDLPPNLKQFEPIVLAAMKDALECGKWHGQYAYITAKTLWVTPENPGNRPGWHSDGFLTDDLNYIWSNGNPTVFYCDRDLHRFSACHHESLHEMDDLCEARISAHERFPSKHLLKLDQSVLHKVETNIRPGLRTFVKVSISEHRYRLAGNSVNHDLAPDWTYETRAASRNCPIGTPEAP